MREGNLKVVRAVLRRGIGVFVLLVIMALSACNNSSGSGSGSSGGLAASGSGSTGSDNAGASSTPYPVRATLEYFVGDKGLYALSPDGPQTPMLVDDAQGGSFTPAGIGPDNIIRFLNKATALKVLALEPGEDAQYPYDAYAAYVFYRRKNGGGFWRVSTAPDSFPPQPVRVSSFGADERICVASFSNDMNDPLNSEFVYATLESGSDCKDPDRQLTYHLLTLSDNASTAARPFPAPQERSSAGADAYSFEAPSIVSLRGRTQSGADGWLIRQNNTLTRLDAQTNPLKDDLIDVNRYFALLARLDDGTLMLDIDGGLYAYEPDADHLKSLRHDFHVTSADSDESRISAVTNGKIMLFQDDVDVPGEPSGRNALFRVTKKADGSFSVQQIDEANSPTIGNYTSVRLGTKRALWYFKARNGTPVNLRDDYFVLRALPLNANGPKSGTTLAKGKPGARIDPLFSIPVSARRVFYNTYDSSDTIPAPGAGSGQPTAHSVALDGSGATARMNSLWYLLDQTQTRILRVDGVTNVASLPGSAGLLRQGVGGKSLESVPAAAPDDSDQTINLGTIPQPSGLRAVVLFSAVGPGLLGQIVVGSGDSLDNAQSDIFYFDLRRPGSLTRVTSTDASDDLPVPVRDVDVQSN